MGRDRWIADVHRFARRYNVDPEAALAVAAMEGLSGRVGDQGTSFGPFQLHVGGALPKGRGRAWAESSAGINYALRKMGEVAGGLRGEAAVRAIVTKFERPADPGKEIAGALSHLGGGAAGASDVGAAGFGATIPGPGASPAVPPSYTKNDAMMEGLKALSEGNYDPQAGLAALRRAAEATHAAQMVQQGKTAADVMFPDFTIKGHEGSPEGQRAAAVVKRYLGVRYVYGGESPKGFDCSGLLQWVWSHQGVQIPRTTYEQWKVGRSVGKGQLRPGDAVFFRGSDARGNLPGHVGMYIGNGQFVEAPHTGSTVHISNLRGRRDYVGARRYA